MALYSSTPDTNEAYGKAGAAASFADASEAFNDMVQSMIESHEDEDEDWDDWAYGTIATCEAMPVCVGVEPETNGDGDTITATPANLTADELAAYGMSVTDGLIRFGEGEYPEIGKLTEQQGKGRLKALRQVRVGTAITFDMGVGKDGRHRYEDAGWANLG